MKRRPLLWSISTAHVASHLIVITVLTIGLAAFGIREAKSRLQAQIVGKLTDIATIAARQIPGARVELIQAGGEGTRMVRRLQKKLEELREASGSASIQVCTADGAQRLSVGRPLEIDGVCALPPGDGWRASLAAGEATWLQGASDPGVTALAPIALEPGRFAVLMVHGDAGALTVLDEFQQRLYVLAAVNAFFAFLISLALARWINGPIRRISAAADEIGSGDYAARVEVPRLQELGVLAQSINTMAAQVERRDRELKALAATVAHEVRNPLNSIKLLVSLLDEELTEAGQTIQQDTVQVLHDEIGRLSGFLNDFLTWSRPVAVDQVPVDAVEPLSSAVRLAEAAAREAEVALVYDPPASVQAALDQDRLVQCLLNLILNAVQASPRGAEVEVRFEANEQVIRYDVMDRGAGIPPEQKPFLFDPFFTTKADGSGLGLCNAQSIAAAHQGRLSLDDRLGGGTLARVELPREGGR